MAVLVGPVDEYVKWASSGFFRFCLYKIDCTTNILYCIYRSLYCRTGANCAGPCYRQSSGGRCPLPQGTSVKMKIHFLLSDALDSPADLFNQHRIHV